MNESDFQERANNIVRKHLSDPDFNVESFAKELGISRMHLHRQLKKITQKSSSEYIRSIRLAHAAILLSQATYSVNEIMLQVGFRNCSYFAKCFRKKYGLAPSAFKLNAKQDF